MMHPGAICSRTILFGLALAAVATTSAARATPQNDVRDLSVGEAVTDLPKAGYAGFACAAEPKLSLSDWRDWRKCPADPSGLHAIRFGYDPGTDPEGTKVAGHLVILELMVGEDARVDGLRITTDPKTRLYHRRRFCWASRPRPGTGTKAGPAGKARRMRTSSRSAASISRSDARRRSTAARC
jgi:hypothetical protein